MNVVNMTDAAITIDEQVFEPSGRVAAVAIPHSKTSQVKIGNKVVSVKTIDLETEIGEAEYNEDAIYLVPFTVLQLAKFAYGTWENDLWQSYRLFAQLPNGDVVR